MNKKPLRRSAPVETENDGVIEMTMMGMTVTFDGTAVIALTGADMQAYLNDEEENIVKHANFLKMLEKLDRKEILRIDSEQQKAKDL